ncbi:MAG: hypothetical protein FJ267_04210 [Planctomycetes bacterium]|nr:hypothetical protein [Planctomycetota bacterium]
MSLAVQTFSSRLDSITPSSWGNRKNSDEIEFTKKLALELSSVFRGRLITRSGDGYFENRFVVINDRHVNLKFADIDRFADQTKQGVTFGQVLAFDCSSPPRSTTTLLRISMWDQLGIQAQSSRM